MNIGMWSALGALLAGIVFWWFTRDTAADHDGNEAESQMANAVGFIALVVWTVCCIAIFAVSGIVHLA